METRSAPPADPYQDRLERELFAEAAYAVGVWVDWSGPLAADPAVPEATVRLGYRFALAQAEATRAVRSAVAAGSPPPDDGQALADWEDWRDHVLPVFFGRGEGLVRAAVRDALRGDFRTLATAAAWYKGLPRALDYRAPLTWAGDDLRGPVEAAVRACWSAASQAESGARALLGRAAADDGAGGPPPWGDVPDDARAVELALYPVGLALSRLTLAVRVGLRGATGLPPLPRPSPPRAVDADGDPVDADGNALPVPPPPTAPAPLVAPAPWTPVLAALAAGAGEVESALLDALAGPPPRTRPALQLGRRWSAYDAVAEALPLGDLPAESQEEVRALAAEVASRARAIAGAAGAGG